MGRERPPPGPSALGLIPAGVGCRPLRPGLFQQTARRYGDVLSFWGGPTRVILLSGPDLARDLLVGLDSRVERRT
jgi:hypothetical protein